MKLKADLGNFLGYPDFGTVTCLGTSIVKCNRPSQATLGKDFGAVGQLTQKKDNRTQNSKNSEKNLTQIDFASSAKLSHGMPVFFGWVNVGVQSRCAGPIVKRG